MSGKLYGVGVGPGDPELLTIKGLRLLQSAPVVAYQSAVGRESVARKIISSYLKPDQIEVLFHLPRALEPESAIAIYDELVMPIEEHLVSGKDVVVLCEGDPLFYGSFMYVFTRLADKFETEVVPGVSSPMACASCLEMPLTYRNDVFTVLPATLSAEVLTEKLQHTDTAAIIKLKNHFDKVRGILKDLDLIDRARYIECATMPEQNIKPLMEVKTEDVPYFSMIILPSQVKL